MKITLEIPDTTVGAFFDYVYRTKTNLRMESIPIEGSELFDGAEIKIKEAEADA